MDGYCSEIVKHVYLSDIMAASSPTSITRYNIKHIITCNIKPISEPLVSSYLWIDSEDMPRQDLISFFEITYSFIEKAVEKKENVLVHCIAGISRSATIVTAYLMKKLRKPAEECIELVRKERSIVDPNEGFRRQLKLYETMGYKINVLNKDYRLIVLDQLASRLSRRHFIHDTETSNAVHEIVHSYFTKLSSTDQLFKAKVVYKCKKCRIKLFTEIHVISDNLVNCKSLYIEPQPWMQSMLTELTVSDINCPSCLKKIGCFDVSGIDCDSKCTTHTSIRPAFKINVNDIDVDNLALPSTVFISQAH
ncbi:dual specificity protein phosphatase 12-like [Panonychus citri]|uniref:dual specificity protein phosphatase 12-like n=1 Tax=Panonychus citri TaxID=50023 RepID=UPI0023081726|nr:dual specificity protein phosphatase 12-like [Panonychus citri]